ncbi:hypothetical protein GC167_01895 [bacterium]|nr:hypothetical protein [bacterium]
MKRFTLFGALSGLMLCALPTFAQEVSEQGCVTLVNTLKSALPMFETTEGSDSWKESKAALERATPVLDQALIESRTCACIELELPKAIEKAQKEIQKGYKTTDWEDTKKAATEARKELEKAVKDIEKCQKEMAKLKKG